jgi:hypothetical protein
LGWEGDEAGSSSLASSSPDLESPLHDGSQGTRSGGGKKGRMEGRKRGEQVSVRPVEYSKGRQSNGGRVRGLFILIRAGRTSKRRDKRGGELVVRESPMPASHQGGARPNERGKRKAQPATNDHRVHPVCSFLFFLFSPCFFRFVFSSWARAFVRPVFPLCFLLAWLGVCCCHIQNLRNLSRAPALPSFPFSGLLPSAPIPVCFYISFLFRSFVLMPRFVFDPVH